MKADKRMVAPGIRLSAAHPLLPFPSPDGTLATDYRFTGARQEVGLGIYHMGARWYDPALARWLSADTLVPEPGNPQAFNRYSYVLGNPLRYTDPTGHIEQDEADRAREIIAILEAYGILIEIDFWLQEIVMHPGPGEPSCNIWHKGDWELSTMEAVLQGVQDMASAMGGQENFKQTFSHGLQFERRSASKYTPLAGAETLRQTITIFDRGVSLQDFAGLKSTVVHELAHAWDQERKGELSQGFEKATWGRTSDDGTYIPGSSPPDVGAVTRGEDWAYSSEAMIYGLGVTLDNPRYTYTARMYPGVQRELEWHTGGR